MKQFFKSSGLKVISILSVFLLILPMTGFAGKKSNRNSQALVKDLVIGNCTEADKAIGELSRHPVSDLTGWIAEFDRYPKPKRKGRLHKYQHVVSDSLTAPYFVYIPKVYKPDTPTPLVVWLHGGVSRPEFIEDAAEYLNEHPIKEICETENWLGLFPMARHDCLWWDTTGMEHVSWLIRQMKRQYNVQDDKVIMCGFSDGGSGSYHYAMTDPTDMAVFFPWSGHISVGSLVGGMQVYVPNLANRPVFAVNGGNDGLYPSERMMPLMKLALDHGADLTFTSFDTAGHNSGYFSEEMPLFVKRVKSISRQPFKSCLYWETDDLTYNRIDWLQIDELDTLRPAADWHLDANLMLKDTRITFGFMADIEFEDEGVKVKSVPEGDSPANQMGLKVGDVIVMMDDIPIGSLDDLGKAKSTKQRGDDVTLIVEREGETFTLLATFPPMSEYPAFPRGRASGAVKAVRLGNSFILETSRVSNFSILIHPDMVRMDQPVIVEVNGKELFNAIIQPDAEYMLKSFIENRDRQLLWVGRIEVRI